MTEPVVKPTVGRRLWYWPGFEDRNAVAAMHPIDHPNGVPQPFDAGVLFVWSDTAVNLQITDHHGGIWFREKVRILTPGEDHNENDALGVAMWMPYQVKATERDKAAEDEAGVSDIRPKASASGISALIDCALAANGLCRSAFQVAQRMSKHHGPSAFGVNWAGLYNTLHDGLEAQQKVLKPYLEYEANRGNTEPFEDRLKRVTKDIGEVGDEHLPYPLADDTSTHETALSETEWRKRATSGKPSNGEIDTMVRAYLGDCGPQATRVYSFVDAIIARWGTVPAQPLDAGAEAKQADSWREVYGFLVAHAQPFMMQPPVPKRGVDQALGTLRELVKYARIGVNLTTKVVPAEKTGSMHEAVRNALHHHKLATKADGVLESDLIAAVLDCLKPVVVPNEVTATMANRMHGEAYGIDWVYAGSKCNGPNCGSTNPAFHTHECHAELNRQIGLSQEAGGSVVANGINLFYSGEFDNETPEGAADRRYAAAKLWGKGWQTGWAEGWQKGWDDCGGSDVSPPDAPAAPEHKA